MEWNELVTRIGKPIWDAGRGRWRVLKGYSESMGAGKRVVFTDEHEGTSFAVGVYFNEEIEEEKASAGW